MQDHYLLTKRLERLRSAQAGLKACLSRPVGDSATWFFLKTEDLGLSHFHYAIQTRPTDGGFVLEQLWGLNINDAFQVESERLACRYRHFFSQSLHLELEPTRLSQLYQREIELLQKQIDLLQRPSCSMGLRIESVESGKAVESRKNQTPDWVPTVVGRGTSSNPGAFFTRFFK